MASFPSFLNSIFSKGYFSKCIFILTHIYLYLNSGIYTNANTYTDITMTSLDDSILSSQNMILLDNVTNYKKSALDYFHHDFDYNNQELPTTWNLLCKMRKHKLLRLPSCSNEDDTDYIMYIERLHHCLWRRWSIHNFNLENKKLNPLSLNWNKETDITVLYGPDLAMADRKNETEEDQCSRLTGLKNGKQIKSALKHSFSDSSLIENIPLQSNSVTSDNLSTYSSSVDSTTSSIFDSPISQSEKPKIKKLAFNNVVQKREINKYGQINETMISVNDIKDIFYNYHQPQYHHVTKNVNSNNMVNDNIGDQYIYAH